MYPKYVYKYGAKLRKFRVKNELREKFAERFSIALQSIFHFPCVQLSLANAAQTLRCKESRCVCECVYVSVCMRVCVCERVCVLSARRIN